MNHSSILRAAHRGASAQFPENTILAFRRAIEQGVDFLEVDVHRTSDNELVIIHDPTLERTTNGKGNVHDHSLHEIRQLDAGQGEKVPTFEEVLELAKTNGVRILPETKSAHLYPGIEEKMLQSLQQANYLDQSVIQSFEADSLEKLAHLNPQAKLCALSGLWKFTVSSPPGDAQYVCPMAEMVFLNPGMIRQAHREGRQVFIWFELIENQFGLSFMRFFGADGLIVDDPTSLKGQ